MAGAFGYELDLNKLTDDEKALVKKQVADYTKYYSLVNWGDYYRLVSPFDKQTHCAWEYVTEDGSEALVTFVIIRHLMHAQHRVYPKGLDANAMYTVEGDGLQNPMHLHGDTIMRAGLPIKIGGDYKTAVLHIVKE